MVFWTRKKYAGSRVNSMDNLLFLVINIAVFILTMLFMIISLKYSEILTSEESWDRLMDNFQRLKRTFLLFSLSLMIYVVAESAELVGISLPASSMEFIHKKGELVHMLIAFIGLLVAAPVFRELIRDEK